MTWWNKDYNGTEDDGGNGSSKPSRPKNVANSKGLFRLRLPYGMEKGRDVLYLDDSPFRFWEHCGKDEQDHWNLFGVCRRKNKIGDDCPPCGQKSINLYNIGFFTGLDLSFAVGKEYRNQKAMYLCEKRLIGAKRGSEEYPGALADIHRIREREGRLRGLVLHQIRKGKKSPQVGDSFEVIERLKPEEMAQFVKAHVRKMWEKGVFKQECDRAQVGVPSKEWFEEKFKAMSFDPAPYEELFQPLSAADLANLYRLPYSGSGQQTTTGGDPFKEEPPFGYDDFPGDDPNSQGSPVPPNKGNGEEFPYDF